MLVASSKDLHTERRLCVCPSDHLLVLIPDVFMVVISEVVVDIIKHAFITKFNDITADVSTIHSLVHSGIYSACLILTVFQVYSEYRASLAFDLVSSRQKNVSGFLIFSFLLSLKPKSLQIKAFLFFAV